MDKLLAYKSAKVTFAESEESDDKTKKQTQFVLSKQSSFRACDAYR